MRDPNSSTASNEDESVLATLDTTPLLVFPDDATPDSWCCRRQVYVIVLTWLCCITIVAATIVIGVTISDSIHNDTLPPEEPGATCGAAAEKDMTGWWVGSFEQKVIIAPESWTCWWIIEVPEIHAGKPAVFRTTSCSIEHGSGKYSVPPYTCDAAVLAMQPDTCDMPMTPDENHCLVTHMVEGIPAALMPHVDPLGPFRFYPMENPTGEEGVWRFEYGIATDIGMRETVAVTFQRTSQQEIQEKQICTPDIS